jgi:hypothetical protein
MQDHQDQEEPVIAELRAALQAFEMQGGTPAPSSRDQAFFSTLRNLLLDITASKDQDERGLKKGAVYKWFMKHRYSCSACAWHLKQPGSRHGVCITAAVTSSNVCLSITGHVGAGMRHQKLLSQLPLSLCQLQHTQQQLEHRLAWADLIKALG